MAGSASEQSEANPVLWLMTQQASWTLDFSLFLIQYKKLCESRVKKFVTVENVTDWEALIERQRSAEDSQT